MALANSAKKSVIAAESVSEVCTVSPLKIKGSFPNKTPVYYVRENIIGERKGVALLATSNINAIVVQVYT